MNVPCRVLSYLLLLLVVVLYAPHAHAQADVADETPVATTSVSSTTVEEIEAVVSYRTEALFDAEVVGDFVLSPGKVELDLDPGETRTIEINVANRIGTPQVFSIDVEDVAASEKPDTAVVLQGDRQGPYSLRDYISIPKQEFLLEHGQRAFIPITITIPADAEPRGHYGSVLLKTVTREAVTGDEPGTVPASAIVSRIGALFFITVPGDVEVAGQLQEFAIKNKQQWFSTGPIQFGITYENTGSRHLNPYGEIRVTNMLGEEVGVVELQPWFVLPDATRLREVTWDRTTLLGRYTATLQLNRGYDNVIDEAVVTFWVIPWQYVVAVFAGVFIFFFLLRTFFRTFEFKRKR